MPLSHGSPGGNNSGPGISGAGIGCAIIFVGIALIFMGAQAHPHNDVLILIGGGVVFAGGVFLNFCGAIGV
jgi:hypothetical protein